MSATRPKADAHPQDADSSGEESDQEDGNDVYPPWLRKVATECAYSVQVLKEEALPRKDGYIECKVVKLPDAQDYAAGRTPRVYKLRKYSSVLVLGGPDEPPYIGLVDKMWRKPDAQAVGGEPGRYLAVDLHVECYWFYRRSELPSTAWLGLKRSSSMPPSIRGGRCAYSSKQKQQVEPDSSRQVLFSSHHTKHDSPQGWISMTAVLQTCKMHWLGTTAEIPERYIIHNNELIKVLDSGFVVQGFYWCNSKDKQQLAHEYRRAFPLDGSWNHAETSKIVDIMCSKYKDTAASLQQHNKQVIEQYTQHTLAQRRLATSGTVQGPKQQSKISHIGFQAMTADRQQEQHQRLQQEHGRGPVQDGSSSESDEHVTLLRRMSSTEVKQKLKQQQQARSGLQKQPVAGHQQPQEGLKVPQKENQQRQQQQQMYQQQLQHHQHQQQFKGPAANASNADSSDDDADDNLTLVQRIRGSGP